MALTGLAPTVPGSLRGRQRQSQTGSMYSGGSHNVKMALTCLALKVPVWHRRFLEVCE